MSLNLFKRPLSLKIKPSLQRWSAIVVPHFLVSMMLLVLNNDFQRIILLALFFLILISLVYSVRLHIYQSLKNSVKIIYQDSAKNWFIEIIDTEKKEVNLSNTSFFSPFLILINFSDSNNKKYTVLITPDSLLSEEYRRLIVRLKMS